MTASRRRRRPAGSAPRLLVALMNGATLFPWVGIGLGAAPAAATCTAGSGLSVTVGQPNDTAPSTVSFQISDPRGPPDWVSWDFGDGLTANHTGNYYLSIAHLYEAFGTYQP